ncbi:MAG: pyridoxal-phosphate dependent enzyme, partial [Patescibacteria group bacterium]|nr:pyridoxal-phosphate dependent enzyme [Patescibacteria group bacterium]
MKINNFIKKIEEAENRIKNIIKKTPLIYCQRLSNIYQSEIYFKREDLQEIRSFKIRGAFNKISKLNNEERKKGVVTASAGNHAQGVAFSCAKMKIKGIIFKNRFNLFSKFKL